MPAAAHTLPDTQHEVVSAFEAIGYPLNKRLEGMLNENIEHQSPRRGSGFTQAGRFLAELINQPRSLTVGGDLKVFAPNVQLRFAKTITTAKMHLGDAPQGISDLRESLENSPRHLHNESTIEQLTLLESLDTKVQLEESKIITGLILSILGKHIDNSAATTLHPTTDNLSIGTCPEAERYFLEYAGGYVRRNGIVNLLYATHQEPIIIEKINIGDSHSCISLTPLILNDVQLPAGSLLGTGYGELPIDTQPCKKLNGAWLPLNICKGFRFLRLSTLAISPNHRTRAFGQHINRQLEGSPFFDPLNTDIKDLLNVALEQTIL